MTAFILSNENGKFKFKLFRDPESQA